MQIILELGASVILLQRKLCSVYYVYANERILCRLLLEYTGKKEIHVDILTSLTKNQK